VRIFSKKGIVDLVNYDATSSEFFITLQNPEITQDREKFYIQLTAYTTGNAVPVKKPVCALRRSFCSWVTTAC
jgi:hypothetical protein